MAGQTICCDLLEDVKMCGQRDTQEIHTNIQIQWIWELPVCVFGLCVLCVCVCGLLTVWLR